jgi:hypothetical protein
LGWRIALAVIEEEVMDTVGERLARLGPAEAVLIHNAAEGVC